MIFGLRYINTGGYRNLHEIQLYKVQFCDKGIVEITIVKVNLVVFAGEFGN